MKDEKYDYSKLVKYYKRKLIDYGVMKELKGYKTYVNCTKIKE